MHYHNVQDEPGGLVHYCDVHGEELARALEPVYPCDCDFYRGCVICEEHDND